MGIIGEAYRSAELEDSYDAVVIGSGIGGLSVAALLAKHGSQRVLVLERHSTAGGMTHVFHRTGYEWDVGLHYIGQLDDPRSPVRAVFDHLTEGRLAWTPMPHVYDRIIVGGRAYDFPSGGERFPREMKKRFPKEGRAIDCYLAEVKASVRWRGLYFAEKVLPFVLAQSLGTLLRWPFMRGARRTTAEVLQRLTADPELRAVLAGQWGNYGLPPSRSSFAVHAMIVDHYLGGASYPLGGASAIAREIAPMILKNGGRILISAEVAEIVLENDRASGVLMADGRRIKARRVISDAGALNTFDRLLPQASHPARRLVEELRRLPQEFGHLCLYVGLRRDPGEPEFGGSNLWVYDDPDHDAALARSFSDSRQPFAFSFISFPSAKDPSFDGRYPGRSTIEIIVPAPFAWFERWADTPWKGRGAEYDNFKKELAGRMLETLYCQVPAARGKVEYSELSTPLSTAHFSNNPRGGIYGLSPSPKRYEIRALGPRTPIRDLFLAGQDAAASGVTGAMMGGVLAASAILGPHILRAAIKPLKA